MSTLPKVHKFYSTCLLYGHTHINSASIFSALSTNVSSNFVGQLTLLTAHVATIYILLMHTKVSPVRSVRMTSSSLSISDQTLIQPSIS